MEISDCNTQGWYEGALGLTKWEKVCGWECAATLSEAKSDGFGSFAKEPAGGTGGV